jgi:hypothetical protein
MLPDEVKMQYARPDYPMEVYIFMHTENGARIATARETLPALRSNHGLSLADWYQLEALKLGIKIDGRPWTVDDKKVTARILYGRWLVDCPICCGANDVDPAEPVYLCSSCYWPGVYRVDAFVPAHFARVEFPRERAEIEKLLLKRPYIRNRNWSPGEMISDLAQQNIENGYEV